MDEIEKKIVEKLLTRIEQTCDSAQIVNYLNFMEAVKLRTEIDRKSN
jgi:hypothetical protein